MGDGEGRREGVFTLQASVLNRDQSFTMREKRGQSNSV